MQRPQGRGLSLIQVNHAAAHRAAVERSESAASSRLPLRCSTRAVKRRVASGRHTLSARVAPAACVERALHSCADARDTRQILHCSKTTAPRPKQKAEGATLCPSLPSPA